MNKLSKEKRNQLLIVIGGTVVVLSLIYFFLIAPQNESLRQIAQSKSDALIKLSKYRDIIKESDDTDNKLQQSSDDLARAENDIATGDIYAWTYDAIRRFKTAYHVDIPNISQPSSVVDVNLIGGFPYKQITLTINGNGFYHDLGKFVADFENNFPHMRVVNLTVEPVGGSGTDAEKLSFRMDIVVLVKTAS